MKSLSVTIKINLDDAGIFFVAVRQGRGKQMTNGYQRVNARP